MTTDELNAAVQALAHAKVLKREAIEREEPVPDEVRAALMVERTANKITRDQSPEVWQRNIAAIEPPALRRKVAWVAWWDFFGDRPACDPWPHLDVWLNEREKKDDVPISRAELEVGLVLAGYSPSHARRRLNGGDCYGTARAKAA